MAKLTVDLKNGLLEVEGDESFVKEVYDDYKEALAMLTAQVLTAKEVHTPELGTGSSKKTGSTNPKPTGAQTHSKGVTREEPTFVPDLNLNPGTKPSLKEIYAKLLPGKSTAMEKNVVFVHYLQRTLGITGIGLNHIYTCYKEVGEKVPVALAQSLRDTVKKGAWIDITDVTNIHMTVRGDNFVEHELPHGSEDK